MAILTKDLFKSKQLEGDFCIGFNKVVKKNVFPPSNTCALLQSSAGWITPPTKHLQGVFFAACWLVLALQEILSKNRFFLISTYLLFLYVVVPKYNRNEIISFCSI